MLEMPQHCATYRGGTPISHAKTRCVKIIDTTNDDFFEQLFIKEKISTEQWQLIKNIRRLAFYARRSQGIHVRLQSHSRHWGMPLVCSDDGYKNTRAEQRWKLFLFYLKPFKDHQWLDQKVLELLLFGGQVLSADDLSNCAQLQPDHAQDHAQLGFSIESIHQILLVIEYVYEKTHRKR